MLNGLLLIFSFFYAKMLYLQYFIDPLLTLMPKDDENK